MIPAEQKRTYLLLGTSPEVAGDERKWRGDGVPRVAERESEFSEESVCFTCFSQIVEIILAVMHILCRQYLKQHLTTCQQM